MFTQGLLKEIYSKSKNSDPLFRTCFNTLDFYSPPLENMLASICLMNKTISSTEEIFLKQVNQN